MFWLELADDRLQCAGVDQWAIGADGTGDRVCHHYSMYVQSARRSAALSRSHVLTSLACHRAFTRSPLAWFPALRNIRNARTYDVRNIFT